MTVHSVAPLQDHIHLALTLGGTPENAPALKWSVTDRQEIPSTIFAFDRGLGGTPLISVLADDSNVIKQYLSYSYIIVIKDYPDYTMQFRRQLLEQMDGKLVYLCDNHHAANGTDHTPDVRTMFVTKLGPLPAFNPDLFRFYCPIELMDADT
jgi:hypothetical protein